MTNPTTPKLRAINHLAFITPDLNMTIRFWRDLMELPLVAGIGHDGFRHYFLQLGPNQIAFFEYEGAEVMERKFAGDRTGKPLGFDHVSFTVDTVEELFAFRDKLQAAGVEVHGVVDHGTIWSIYFYDPNNIPLEITWPCMDLLKLPAIEDDRPLEIAAEGSDPRPHLYPDVTTPTPESQFRANSGNGYPMRKSFVERGIGRVKERLKRLLGDEAY